MSWHILQGRRGEELAAHFLGEQGYAILHRNWRGGGVELDLIAEKKGKLHIVEVKLRTGAAYGHPEGAVTREKFRQLRRGADAFLRVHPRFLHLQFDVIAITALPGAAPEILLIEDVHFWRT